MKPALFVVRDSDWPTFDAKATNAAYERYGILPGAFYLDSTDTVYTSESAWLDALSQQPAPWRAAGLLEHEYGHALNVAMAEHPTAILAGLEHAARCGFDSRAFTRLLRWRWNPVSHAAFLSWLDDADLAWRTGALRAQPAPDFS